MDVLTLQVEYDQSVAPNALEQIRQRMEEEVRARCGVRAIIQLVPAWTFPRTEFKARRVIDKRDLYEELKSLRKA